MIRGIRIKIKLEKMMYVVMITLSYIQAFGAIAFI